MGWISFNSLMLTSWFVEKICLPTAVLLFHLADLICSLKRSKQFTHSHPIVHSAAVRTLIAINSWFVGFVACVQKYEEFHFYLQGLLDIHHFAHIVKTDETSLIRLRWFWEIKCRLLIISLHLFHPIDFFTTIDSVNFPAHAFWIHSLNENLSAFRYLKIIRSSLCFSVFDYWLSSWNLQCEKSGVVMANIWGHVIAFLEFPHHFAPQINSPLNLYDHRSNGLNKQ